MAPRGIGCHFAYPFLTRLVVVGEREHHPYPQLQALVGISLSLIHICSGGFGSKTVKASKNYVTKDIKVNNFTKLSVAGSPDVTYTQKSGKPTVEVYTSDNIVDLLDIRVKDNTLDVYKRQLW